MEISKWKCKHIPEHTGFIKHYDFGYVASLEEGFTSRDTLKEAEEYMIGSGYEKVV